MFGLGNLFAQTSAQKFYISRDRIAEILRVSPDALDLSLIHISEPTRRS